MNDSTTLESFNGIARLFPLPNLVLFPQVIQGLHIFETRYRQLMADALADDQLLALAVLKPGWERDYEGQPPIDSVACLCRVNWHEKLPDGRYNLRVRGLSRIRILEEIPSARLYRLARVELMPDAGDLLAETAAALRQALASEVLSRFTDDEAAHRQLNELFTGEMALGQICDVLAYVLPFSLEIKQLLLGEVRAERRAEVIMDGLRASAARTNRKFPPDFSVN